MEDVNNRETGCNTWQLYYLCNFSKTALKYKVYLKRERDWDLRNITSLNAWILVNTNQPKKVILGHYLRNLHNWVLDDNGIIIKGFFPSVDKISSTVSRNVILKKIFMLKKELLFALRIHSKLSQGLDLSPRKFCAVDFSNLTLLPYFTHHNCAHALPLPGMPSHDGENSSPHLPIALSYHPCSFP